MSSVLPRLLALARYLFGFTALLALTAIVLVSALSSTHDGRDRCSEWVRPRDMDPDEVARCAASGFEPAQIEYGQELYFGGRREEAETWFEAAVAGRNNQGRTARAIAMLLEWNRALPEPGEVHAAERWYRRSFELGSDMAAVQLASGLEGMVTRTKLIVGLSERLNEAAAAQHITLPST